MTFKEWAYECEGCGARPKILHWDTDPIPACPMRREDCTRIR
jgi:hypothetical protein